MGLECRSVSRRNRRGGADHNATDDGNSRMMPVNLNPMVPMSPGDLARLKAAVARVMRIVKKTTIRAKVEQSVMIEGDNITVGDIRFGDVNMTAAVIEHLYNIKEIVDRMAITPPGTIKVPVYHAPPKHIEYHGETLSLDSGVRWVEIKENIARIALEKHSGNRTHAAEELGISVRSLRYWINKYELKEE